MISFLVVNTTRYYFHKIYELYNLYNNNKYSTVFDIHKELVRFYKKDKFIKILKFNSLVSTNDAINTNNCIISVCKSKYKNKAIILSSIDNLIKGGAGQAIQNMNIKYGFNETKGLK